METNTNFQHQFYELCERLGNSESALLQSLGNFTAIDENPYRKLYYFKAQNALFRVINGKLDSIVCPVSSINGKPFDPADNTLSFENRSIGMTWFQSFKTFGTMQTVTTWDVLVKDYRTKNGITIQILASYGDNVELGDKIDLDRYLTHFRANIKSTDSPSSINPMLLSNFDFARYRHVGDDYMGVNSLTVIYYMDFDYIYPKLQTILKNNDPVNFDDVRLNNKVVPTDKPEFYEMTKKVMRTFLTEYFADNTADSQGRPREQWFYFSADEKIILQNAAKLFCTHMTEATLALAFRSLLKQYAAYNSTNVLVYTRLLPKYPHRRILATMQFVMDVMDINAYEPEGKGIRAIQKLRLTHDMIRNRIMMTSAAKDSKFIWNEKEWGSPINQQDMLFAIHTFSVEVIQGLLSSGVQLKEEEINNYYLAWHLIGRALGVSSKINPTNYKIGVDVQQRIYNKEFTEDNPNATVLGDPLIQFLDDMLPLATSGAVLSMVKLFNDKKDYDTVFKKILKLDLSKAHNYYVILYKLGIRILHAYVDIKYLFSKNKTNYIRDTANLQHKLFSFIINKVKTWSDNNFRVADGFGEQFAIQDEKIRKK